MNNAKKLRGAKSLTQTEFAQMLGISRQALISIENGNTKNLSRRKMQIICNYLETTPVKFLGEDNLRYLPETIEDIDFIINLLNKKREKLQ